MSTHGRDGAKASEGPACVLCEGRYAREKEPGRRLSFYTIYMSLFQKSLENASPALGRVNALSLHLGNTTDTDLSMLDNLDLLQTINNGYLFLNH